MISLSVHLITYNNQNHIEATLESIINQKVDFIYEIVVGDDCSTDNTLEIISQYKNRYPELFKIKKNDSQLGILKNFKATLDRCAGDYVFDIAGDDFLKNKYALQKMVSILRNDNNLGFVDSGFDKLYEDSGRIMHFANKKTLESSKDLYKEQLLLGRINPIGICFNKKHLYQFVDFDTYLKTEITIEDYPILVDLAMNTNFETINESLHTYRIHGNSYSHTKSFENHYFLKRQMKRLFEHFCVKYQFNQGITNTFNQDYYKEILFLAGYFQKKELGKKTYNMIKAKSIKDHIHYFASQSPLFRRLVSIL